MHFGACRLRHFSHSLKSLCLSLQSKLNCLRFPLVPSSDSFWRSESSPQLFLLISFSTRAILRCRRLLPGLKWDQRICFVTLFVPHSNIPTRITPFRNLSLRYYCVNFQNLTIDNWYFCGPQKWYNWWDFHKQPFFIFSRIARLTYTSTATDVVEFPTTLLTSVTLYRAVQKQHFVLLRCVCPQNLFLTHYMLIS